MYAVRRSPAYSAARENYEYLRCAFHGFDHQSVKMKSRVDTIMYAAAIAPSALSRDDSYIVQKLYTVTLEVDHA